MALLTVQDATDGAAITMVAATAGGDQIPGGTRAAGWDLGVVLVVRNDDGDLGTDKVVTVERQDPVTVPKQGGVGVIPVYAGTYGMVRDITYSDVTAVTIAAVKTSGS